MYDPVKLQERMAELGLNFRTLAQQAKIDPKTAKTIVLTGRGWPHKIKAVAKVLKFKLPDIVKRAATEYDREEELVGAGPRRKR